MKIIRPTCPRAGSEKLSYSHGRSPDSPPVLLAYLPIDSVDSGNQRMASSLMEEYSSGHCAGLAPDFPLVMGCAPQAESASHHSSQQRYTKNPPRQLMLKTSPPSSTQRANSPGNVEVVHCRSEIISYLCGALPQVRGGAGGTPRGCPLPK